MLQQSDFKLDKTRILVVDDHPVVRLGLAYLINQNEDLLVCGEADSAHKALDAIEKLCPDMAIVDVCLKGQSGIGLIKNIKGRYPEFPILVLSIHDENVYAEHVLRAGAKGYIMKNDASSNIIHAIRKVLNGEIYVSEKMTSKILNKFINEHPSCSSGSPIEFLSDRELEVFHLLGQGYGTRQIAEELYLSIKTVETYRGHIKNKLNLKNASELVKYAIKWVQRETIS
ncbi:response regulator transcription factor [bacterium]|nr:response regulator transcription factor [bacterium]